LSETKRKVGEREDDDDVVRDFWSYYKTGLRLTKFGRGLGLGHASYDLGVGKLQGAVLPPFHPPD